MVIISEVTRIICFPEQLLCQTYKKWSSVTRKTCSYFSSYCNFIYFIIFPNSFEENKSIFRLYKYYIQNKTKLVCKLNNCIIDTCFKNNIKKHKSLRLEAVLLTSHMEVK